MAGIPATAGHFPRQSGSGGRGLSVDAGSDRALMPDIARQLHWQRRRSQPIGPERCRHIARHWHTRYQRNSLTAGRQSFSVISCLALLLLLETRSNAMVLYSEAGTLPNRESAVFECFALRADVSAAAGLAAIGLWFPPMQAQVHATNKIGSPELFRLLPILTRRTP